MNHRRARNDWTVGGGDEKYKNGRQSPADNYGLRKSATSVFCRQLTAGGVYLSLSHSVGSGGSITIAREITRFRGNQFRFRENPFSQLSSYGNENNRTDLSNQQARRRDAPRDL